MLEFCLQTADNTCMEITQTLQDFMADRDARTMSREMWRGVGGTDPLVDTTWNVATTVTMHHDYPDADLFDALDERNMA